jgi:GGDEF domain-containing protein
LVHIAAEAGEVVHGKRFLSMSVGEAFYPMDGANAEELLATADRRMYKSKQQQKLRQTSSATVQENPALTALSVQ